MKKILIVDDDEVIRKNLEILLADEYIPYCAESASEVLDILPKNDIELCLLDVNLKEEDGFQLCRKIRSLYTMPIIFITVKDDEDSLEKGILSGGDDYITKPFSIRELKLRIMAQLRRQSLFHVKRERIVVDEWKLDVLNHMFFYRDMLVDISKTEFTLLKHLMQNKNCLVSRQVLLNEITELNDTFVEDNTLTVYISRLKNKLIQASSICPIETIRGVGYRWKEESV